MGFLSNKYLDLTHYSIGPKFWVESIAGRDERKAPLWRIVCRTCDGSQILPHRKVVALVESNAAANLLCTNSRCLMSKPPQVQSESFADVRRAERLKTKAEEQAATEASKAAEMEAAKQSEKDAKLAALRREWQAFWRHQIQTDIEESKIVTFQRWTELTEQTRQMLLERTKTDPTIWFEGL